MPSEAPDDDRGLPVAERPEPRVALRVVRGAPDDAELAALVAVLAARRAGASAPSPAPPQGWAAYWRRVGAAPPPGAGAWTAASRGR